MGASLECDLNVLIALRFFAENRLKRPMISFA